MLPSNITTRCALQMIDLHGNKIEGRLPRGLSNCTDLEVIDFGSNKIADAFPSWLRGLPKLSVLVLRSNQMYGTIGDIVGDTKREECFPSLQIIDLASNNFSGTLRPQWFKQLKSMMAEFNSSGKTLEILNTINVNDREHSYQYSVEIMYKGADMPFGRMLTTVTAIDFSKNSLEGTIPETFGSLVSLRVLSLSHNAFTGKIPAQLGSMTDLESLDLSCNQLSGDIPQELTDLTFLGSLNLSYNHLVGKIPQSRQFSTFDSSSFEGNAGLCGLQLPKFPCGSSPHSPGVAHGDKSSRHIDVVLFLFVGLGFGVGFAAAIVVKWDRFGRRFYCNCKSLAYLITTRR
ncbi:receptor-like protein 12 isoform X5 [Setaria italica]|nr:receptor-like protein 12 isoform X5 [Setaria italica]